MNGYPKKALLLITIEALLTNPHASIESHLHIVCGILVSFVTSTQLSINDTPEEAGFRERSALILGRVVNK